MIKKFENKIISCCKILRCVSNLGKLTKFSSAKKTKWSSRLKITSNKNFYVPVNFIFDWNFCKNCFKFRWKIFGLIFKRKERFWIEISKWILSESYNHLNVMICPQSKFQSIYKVTYTRCTFSEWLLMNYVEYKYDVTVVWNKF